MCKMNSDDFITRSQMRLKMLAECTTGTVADNLLKIESQMNSTIYTGLPNVVQHYYLTIAEQESNTDVIARLRTAFPDLDILSKYRLKLLKTCQDDNQVEQQVCEKFNIEQTPEELRGFVHNYYTMIRMTLRKRGRPKLTETQREQSVQKHKLRVSKNMERVYNAYNLTTCFLTAEQLMELQKCTLRCSSQETLQKLQVLIKIFTKKL
jgi:hypothetical protein